MAHVALLGCGGWGSNIAKSLGRIGALRMICDPDRQRAEAMARDLGVTWNADPQAAFSSDTIDAVVIATPAATHAAVTLRALEAGKHVFVEKPMALTLNDACRMADQATKNNRILFVGHLLHYHPAFVRLREAVAAGDTGAVRYVYSNRLNSGRIRTEENALWSLAPHDLSMILALAGEEPREISASGVCVVQPKLHDLATVDLRFENGIRGHIFSSWLSPYKEHRLTVIGDKAALVFEDTAPAGTPKLRFYPEMVKWTDNMPVYQKSEGVALDYDNKEPLIAELEAFVTSVRTGCEPISAPAEAIPVLRCLLNAQTALETGLPVTLE